MKILTFKQFTWSLVLSWMLLPHLAFADRVVRDPLGPVKISNTYFNMHVRWGATTIFWPAARFHSWRVISGETHWYHLEPEKGVWNFNELDRAIERAEWKKVEVLYTLGYPARWAADTTPPRQWNPGAALPPKNMADWEEYIRRVVSRYKGRIKYYELMNEPHFTDVDGGSNSTRLFPVEKMVEMARIASSVIKQLAPEAKLVSMSPSGGLNGVRRVNSFLKAGGGKYIDAVGFHFYSDTPEQIPDLVNSLRKVLTENGQPHLDIWNTESGFYIDSPDKKLDKTGALESQTFYSAIQGGAVVSRALTLGAAAGIRRFYWYSWDIPTLALTEGKGKVITPAGRAYIKTEKWLRESTIDDCRATDHKLWICSLSRAQRKAWLVWNTSGKRDWVVPTDWEIKQSESLFTDEAEIFSGKSAQINESPTLFVSDNDTWGAP